MLVLVLKCEMLGMRLSNENRSDTGEKMTTRRWNEKKEGLSLCRQSWGSVLGHEEAVHLLKLLLRQHEAVHLLLSRGAWDADAANKPGSSLLLFFGL